MQISETHAYLLKPFGDRSDFAVIAMAHCYGYLYSCRRLIFDLEIWPVNKKA